MFDTGWGLDQDLDNLQWMLNVGFLWIPGIQKEPKGVIFNWVGRGNLNW